MSWWFWISFSNSISRRSAWRRKRPPSELIRESRSDARSSRPNCFGSFFVLAPAAGADPKTARKHQAEQAHGLVTAFEGDLDDFEVGGGEEFAGFFEAKLSLFLTK